MTTLTDWAARWNIPAAALQELLATVTPPVVRSPLSGEQAVQQEIRAAAPAAGCILWRNNSGAAVDPDTGRPIRYGLGNDSKQINAVLKSSDLIGITPVTVTAAHVGQVLGVFTAVEVKRPGWTRPSGKREQAQATFLSLVERFGGVGTFAADVSHYAGLVERARRS